MERKNRTFIEDHFELNEFQKQANLLKDENFRKKNENLFRALSLLIVILAFVIAYLAYTILDYYIGIWRNESPTQKAGRFVELQIDGIPPAPDLIVLRQQTFSTGSSPAPAYFWDKALSDA